MLVSIWLTVWPPSSMITSYPPEFLESASIWSNSFWSAWSPAGESSFYAPGAGSGTGLKAGLKHCIHSPMYSVPPAWASMSALCFVAHGASYSK